MTRQGTAPSIDPIPREPADRRKMSRWLVLALVALTALTFLLRAWELNTIPPGLFGDEAQAGVDVQAWLRGESTQLFPHHLGGETLYGYLSIPFVALWDGTPLAIRIVSALMGALMIPALFLAALALWRGQPRMGPWAGLIAAALWMVNYWPQSVNRIGFQVNTQPLLVTLAVVAWLAWTYRPTRGRAVAFGLLAALTLYTYPAARITPLLWPLLYVALPPGRRQRLRSTLLWAAAAFGVTVAPVAVHFALNPYYLTLRSQTLSALGCGWTARCRWPASTWAGPATPIRATTCRAGQRLRRIWPCCWRRVWRWPWPGCAGASSARGPYCCGWRCSACWPSRPATPTRTTCGCWARCRPRCC